MADFTDEIYFASKDPQKNALRELPPADRQAAAEALSAKGFVIDKAIDIWGWDPTKIMAVRIQYGQPYTLDGITGTKTIKSSLDAADYPPFAPASTPPVVRVMPVGEYIGNGLYRANITACMDGQNHMLFADGQTYTQDGVEYIFHLTKFWGIPSINWSKA